MNLSPAEMMEFSFNVAYLVSIYALVILMSLKLPKIEDPQGIWRRFRNAFLLLGLGDTGHVGFRTYAYAAGGVAEHQVLISVGSLATAITMTLFFMILLEAGRIRFGERRGLAYWLIQAFGIARLIVMAFPQNGWWDGSKPYAWSLARNGLFALLCLGMALYFALIARRRGDREFGVIAAWTFATFVFYAPVVLFSRFVPMLGMLMIPKTCCYVAIGIYGYLSVFTGRGKTDAGTERPAMA